MKLNEDRVRDVLETPDRHYASPALRSLSAPPIRSTSTSLARFDKRVQIRAIDEHATERLALTIAFPRSQRWHVNNRNQTL